MYTDYVELIGLVAGTLTTLAFIPQIMKVHKKRSARDLSGLWMFGFFLGIMLWLIYGIMDSSLPIILSNGALFCLGILLGVLKVRYDGIRTKR
jgi:MtN3 and saliva related transmembrane protein